MLRSRAADAAQRGQMTSAWTARAARHRWRRRALTSAPLGASGPEGRPAPQTLPWAHKAILKMRRAVGPPVTMRSPGTPPSIVVCRVSARGEAAVAFASAARSRRVCVSAAFLGGCGSGCPTYGTRVAHAWDVLAWVAHAWVALAWVALAWGSR
eukprot:365210-Chlamydomonas_euryale.AAC.2